MEWVASSLQLDSEQSIQCYYNRFYACNAYVAAADVNTVAKLVVEFHGQMGDYYLFRNCVPWTSFIQGFFMLG